MTVPRSQVRRRPTIPRAPGDLETAVWSDWSCHVRLVVDRPGAIEAARREVQDLMNSVALAASRFRQDSDLSRINASAGRPVAVRPLTVVLVKVALDAARATGGFCDPTLGLELVAAGYDTDIDEVRGRVAESRTTTPNRPRGPVREPLWQRVVVDDDLATVRIPAGSALDLGACAKAWTAEHAARAVAERLDTATMVEIGGDLAVRGTPGRPWRVTVSERPASASESRSDAGEPASAQAGPAEANGGEADGDEADAAVADESVDIAHGGIATSSVLARRWATADGEAHHVLDPRTGRPARGVWRTASVWAASAIEANALSTAALCIGDQDDPATFRDLLGRADASARLVEHGGRVVRTAGWPGTGASRTTGTAP